MIARNMNLKQGGFRWFHAVKAITIHNNEMRSSNHWEHEVKSMVSHFTQLMMRIKTLIARNMNSKILCVDQELRGT
jgi:hypothetical protein